MIFSSPIGAPLLGYGDAFALALPDQCALEFGKRAHHREHEIGHRRILAGESQALFDELDPNAAPGEGLDQLAQVVEIAREAVHAVHDHCVAFPDE